MNGWLEGGAFVVAIGALSLVYALGHALGAHPIAFVLYATLVAAAAILAYTGLGADARAIALYPRSFVVGISIILIEFFYFLTLTYVPPAHGNVVLRIGIPIALLAGWVLFGRRPPPLVAVGGVIVAATVAFVVAITVPQVRWPLAAVGSLAGAFMVVRGFASEFHRWNRAARTVPEKLRVTGILLVVTSLIGVVLAALAASAVAAAWIPPHPVVPTVAEMTHLPTILLGVLAGGPILALMNYLSFSTVVKITTENFTAIMAFSPLTTWVFQEIGVASGLIVAARPGPALVAAMAIIIGAVLLIIWTGRRVRRS